MTQVTRDPAVLLETLDTQGLRTVARLYGISPHFIKNGKPRYLANATLRQRLYEDAVIMSRGESLLRAIDKVLAQGPTDDVLAHVEAEAERHDVIHAESTPGNLLTALDEFVKTRQGVDEAQVEAIVRREVLKVQSREPQRIVVTRPDLSVTSEMLVHKQFPELLQMVQAGVYPYICGPAGSGKTEAARQVAEALDLSFYFNGAIDTEYKLMGFMDAQGRVVSTPFRRAVTDGGVYLFDEVDGSMPSALLAFNAALSNGHCDFPGSELPVPKHACMYPMAAANTWGYGTDSQYVGRGKLDGSTLDRFTMIEWDYDEELERKLAGNDAWVDTVIEYRRKAAEIGLKVIISPRASMNGAKLLASGMSRNKVIHATIGAKLSKQDRKALGVPACN